MQVSRANKPSFNKFLFLGLVLILLGSIIVASVAFYKPTETVSPHTFNEYTKNTYFNMYTVWAGEGYWFDLNITTDGPSILRVKGEFLGDFYLDQGTQYKYRVDLPQGDVYQIQVENAKKISNGSALVNDEIHIEGDWYLRKPADYVTPLNLAGDS
jgi:hypothetical protein